MGTNHLAAMREFGISAFVADAMLVSAQALLQLGRGDEARAQLQIARTVAMSINQRRMLWQILPLLADLTADPTEATAMRAEAAAIMADIRDQLPNEELRASFLALPDVRRILTQ